MDTYSTSTSHYMLYEKPLNETMRLLLRLDSLFVRYAQLHKDNHPITQDSRLAMLLRLIAITDRADLKSKLTQLLHQLIYRLQQWQQHQDANPKPIQQALTTAQQCLTYFDQIQEQKSHDIHDWMKEFSPLKNCIDLLLHFIRQNSGCDTVWVEQGFYQQPIDAKKTIQLFQIKVPLALNIYPNISAGRHHVSIHFTHVSQAGFDISQPYAKPFECILCFCDL